MGPHWRKKEIYVKGQILQFMPFSLTMCANVEKLKKKIKQNKTKNKNKKQKTKQKTKNKKKKTKKKNVVSGTQTIAQIKQTEKKFESCWFSIFNNFLNIFLKPMHSK